MQVKSGRQKVLKKIPLATYAPPIRGKIFKDALNGITKNQTEQDPLETPSETPPSPDKFKRPKLSEPAHQYFLRHRNISLQNPVEKKESIASGFPRSPPEKRPSGSKTSAISRLGPNSKQLNKQKQIVSPSQAKGFRADDKKEELYEDSQLQGRPKSFLLLSSEPSISVKTSPQSFNSAPFSTSSQKPILPGKLVLALNEEPPVEVETFRPAVSHRRKKKSKSAPPVVSALVAPPVVSALVAPPVVSALVETEIVILLPLTPDSKGVRTRKNKSDPMADKSSLLRQPELPSRQQKLVNARKMAAVEEHIAPPVAPPQVRSPVKSSKISDGFASPRKETLVTEPEPSPEKRLSPFKSVLSSKETLVTPQSEPTGGSCPPTTPSSKETLFSRTQRLQPTESSASSPVHSQQVAPPSLPPIASLSDIIPLSAPAMGRSDTEAELSSTVLKQELKFPRKSGFQRFRSKISSNETSYDDVKITTSSEAPLPFSTKQTSLIKISQQIPKSNSRFSRDPNPSLPTGNWNSPAKSTAVDLGPYAEMFRTGLPRKLKFIDSHSHFCFTLNKLNSLGIRSYSGLRERFPELFPASYGGSVQVFCHPQYLRAPDQWREKLMEGTQNQLWFTYGCHPNWADQWDDDVKQGMIHSMDQARALNRLVALGEIGLDYSRFNSSEEKRLRQRQILATQLQMAVQRNLPIVIHCRNDEGPTGNNQADLDCLEIVQQYVPRAHKLHRHCFTGSFEEASSWRDHFPNVMFGFTPSKNGKNHSAQDAIQNLPIEAMLLETDAPYFIPSGMRNFPMEVGERSSGNRVAIPGGIALVTASEISKLKGLPLTDVVAAATENTCFIYGICL